MIIGIERRTAKRWDESEKYKLSNTQSSSKEDSIYMIDVNLSKERDAEFEMDQKEMEEKMMNNRIAKRNFASYEESVINNREIDFEF